MPIPLVPAIAAGVGLAGSIFGAAKRSKAEKQQVADAEERARQQQQLAQQFAPNQENYTGAVTPYTSAPKDPFSDKQRSAMRDAEKRLASLKSMAKFNPGLKSMIPKLEASMAEAKAKDAAYQQELQEYKNSDQYKEDQKGWMQRFDDRANEALERPVEGPYEQQQRELAQQAAAQAQSALENPYESQQMDIAQQLLAQSQGLLDGPSAAELQMRQGYDQAQRGVASQLASMRGVNPAVAARLAANQSANLTSENAMNSSILRAQEDAQRQQLAANMRGSAANLYGNLSGQRNNNFATFQNLQGQAGGLYGNMTGQQQNQQNINNSLAQMLMGQGVQRAGMQQAAGQAYESARERDFLRQTGALDMANQAANMETQRRLGNAQMLGQISGGIMNAGIGALTGGGGLQGLLGMAGGGGGAAAGSMASNLMAPQLGQSLGGGGGGQMPLGGFGNQLSIGNPMQATPQPSIASQLQMPTFGGAA